METATVVPVVVPEVEVSAKAKRRQFTAEYKRGILEKTDALKDDPGGIGELLRREGLYSSHLSTWRNARRAGELAGLGSRRRGPAAKRPDSRDRELAEARREIAKLKARAERAEALVELQKKVALLMGDPIDESGEKQ